MHEQDLETWKAWKKNQTEENLSAVLRALDPLIQHEVNRWAGTLARPVLELEAKRLAVEGIKSYSPTGGASLSTHVMNQMKRMSRLSYTHQNIARMPEHQVLKFHTYNLASSALQDRLGREPTADELGEELGWTPNQLTRFQKSVRKEFTESGPMPMFDTSTDDGGVVDFLYHDLSPMQKKIFEHTTGYGGAPILRNPQITKQLKITQGQLSYQKRLMVDQIQKRVG